LEALTALHLHLFWFIPVPSELPHLSIFSQVCFALLQ
jgi:hypothetical protein